MAVDTESPTFVEVLKEAIEGKLYALHTAMPATIVSYDATKQKASVQPVLKKKRADGTVFDLPVIPNVPVVFPRSGKAFLSLPLQAGDGVLVVFSERSMERWLGRGGQVDPQSSRRHDLSDAIAIPGLFPFSQASATMHASNVRMENDQSRLELLPNGKFVIKNLTTGDDLLDLFSQFIDAVVAGMVATSMGPQPLVNANFATIKGKLAALKGGP